MGGILSKSVVESREAITLRPSLLNPYVRLSVHTASETLRVSFCSCVSNRGRTHVLLQGFPASNCDDFHQYGVDVLSLRS